MGEGEKLRLGYWKIRGLAAPARMMCHYAKLDYEDVTYESIKQDDGTFSKAQWFEAPDAKPGLRAKNPFMNLPWCEYKGNVVTQSNAVMLFIGRVAGLNGSNETEINRNEQTLFQIFDLRNSVVGVAYPPKDEQKLEAHFTGTLNTHYKKLENWLKFHNTAFFACDKPLCADFHVFEMLDQHEGWASTIGRESPLANYPKLTQFYNRMLDLPELKSYFDSEISKWNYNNPHAQTFLTKPGGGYGPKK